MKLTYMLSPTTFYVMHTQTSNILSHNLLRDNRIDVSFNLSILSLCMDIINEKDSIIERMSDHPLDILLKKASPNYFKIVGAPYSTRTGFFEKILPTIKTEIVLITCWNIYCIPFIKFLLNSGKKVVMGGSFCNSYPIKFIRSLLGDPDNLIVVSGYVGVQTDLHKVISDWKDVKLPETDFIDMWTAKNDHMKSYLKILSKCRRSDNTYYSITFNNNCWYNKCKFCKLREERVPDFTCAVDADRLYENIKENLITYKTKKLLVNDNYFLFSDKNREIFKNLRKDGFKIYILSGILSFNNEQYLRDFNEYVDEVGIGLESASDFSLDYITKGYKWEDIKRSIHNMAKYLDKDKNIRYLTITDLVSKDREDIVENYENMLTMKMMLNDHGFERVAFSYTPLQLFPSIDLVKDTEFMKIGRTESSSGMWYVYEHLKKYGIEVNVPEDIMMPFERYDINGNLLLSDFEYVGDLMDRIIDPV